MLSGDRELYINHRHVHLLDYLTGEGRCQTRVTIDRALVPRDPSGGHLRPSPVGRVCVSRRLNLAVTQQMHTQYD